MKTLNLIAILTLVLGLSINSYSKEPVKRYNNNIGSSMNSNFDSYKVTKPILWYDNFKVVVDIIEAKEGVNMSFVDMEDKLPVMDYVPTNDIIPSWLIIEDEIDLPVTDLQ